MKNYVAPEVEFVEFNGKKIATGSDDGPCLDYSCNGYGTICSGGHDYN